MSERKIPADHILLPILKANNHLTRQQLIDKMGWDIKAANLGRHASRLGHARQFRRPSKLPPNHELIPILKQHEDMSYKAIHAMYGWGGNWRSIANRAAKAGYRRQGKKIRIGGGPMDIMSHEEFWGQVDRHWAQHVAELEDRLRAQAEDGKQRTGSVIKIRRRARRRTAEVGET